MFYWNTVCTQESFVIAQDALAAVTFSLMILIEIFKMDSRFF
jgi:hypothetical protein